MALRQDVTVHRTAELAGGLTRMDGGALYRTLFEESPIAILEEDWSGPKRAVDAVKASGIGDFEQFLLQRPDFIGEVRQQHRVVDANLAAMRLFGYSDKNAFLKRTREVLPANYESNSRVLSAIASAARSAEGERLLRTQDGQIIPILWRTVFPSPDGDFSRLLFYAVDVSALKRTEEALGLAQAELGKASRIAMVGEMAASIAHEINQPLGAIRLFADTAKRWVQRPEPNLSRALRSMGEVAANADRAAAIVQRVKNLVRREAPVTQAVSLKQAVHEAFALLSRDARRAGITLACELPVELPQVEVDATQLQQVLVNLIGNAIQAMAAAGTARARLDVHAALAAEPGRILTLVEDNGPGFTPSSAARIFDPFFSTRTEGMGLGLSICKSIVEAHGGTITASERAEGGARFAFSLPVSGSTST